MFEAALKKLGMKLSTLISGLMRHRRPYALPWNRGIAPRRFRILVIAPSLAAGTLHRVKIDFAGALVFSSCGTAERYARPGEKALFASFRM